MINDKFKEIYDVNDLESTDLKTFLVSKYGDNPKQVNELYELITSNVEENMNWNNYEIERKNGRKSFINAKNILLKESDLMISYVYDVTNEVRQKKVMDYFHKMNQIIASNDEPLQNICETLNNMTIDIFGVKSLYVGINKNNTQDASQVELIHYHDRVDTEKPKGILDLSNGLTGYVAKKGECIFLDNEEILNLAKTNEINIIQTPPKKYLGAPINIKDEIAGFVAIQAYNNENLLLKEDIKIFNLIVDKVTNAIRTSNLVQSLNDAKNKFKAITENSKDGIVLINAKGAIDYINSAFCNLVGYEKEDVLGKNFHELFAPERFHEAHKEGFAKYINTGKGYAIGKTLDLEILHKNKYEIPVSLSLGALKTTEGFDAVGNIRDETERKILEQEGNARIGRIVHDIKNFLNPVINYSEILLEEYSEKINGTQEEIEENKFFLTNIYNVSRYIKNLSTSVLIQVSDKEYDKENITIENSINEIVDINKSRFEIDKINLITSYECNEKIYFNEDVLKSVVFNFLDNAYKYTDKNVNKNIFVNTYNQDNFAILEIKDQGRGMSQELVNNIINKKVKKSRVGNNNEKGTGYALNNLITMLEKENIKLDIFSELDQGSSFKLYFPIVASID
ncbi:PAS domain S-box protein [Candidatus Woesearchaeota archaeon]|nr:PAS domain S-box protein [Candidatus Woesearchaeota archaeon]MCF7901646.1 PAS domain S-box protein [Candidatus Woesearchaeota archaeon]MCF8014047.1 PAS domain S-box protein [Candidatus Woesearchaeota archaeon]